MQTWATLGTELRSWAGHPRGRPGWSSQFPVSALLPSVSLSSCLKESKAHFSAKLKISILLLQCARLCFHKFFNSFHFQGNLEFQALVREGPPTTSPPPPSRGHCGQGAPETTSAASLLLISDVLTNTRPRLEHCGYVCAFVSPGKNDRPRETSFRPCADCQYLADTPSIHSQKRMQPAQSPYRTQALPPALHGLHVVLHLRILPSLQWREVRPVLPCSRAPGCWRPPAASARARRGVLPTFVVALLRAAAPRCGAPAPVCS